MFVVNCSNRVRHVYVGAVCPPLLNFNLIGSWEICRLPLVEMSLRFLATHVRPLCSIIEQRVLTKAGSMEVL